MQTSTSKCAVIFTVLSICVLSGCTQAAINKVRQIHTEVRSVFVEVDSIVAPLLETAGDQCMSQFESETGQEGYDHTMECMRPWFAMDDAITLIREILAEMETIYQSVENFNSERWLALVGDLRSHARNLSTIILELNIPVSEQIMNLLERAQTILAREA